jgi:hypothetical protein
MNNRELAIEVLSDRPADHWDKVALDTAIFGALTRLGDGNPPWVETPWFVWKRDGEAYQIDCAHAVTDIDAWSLLY